MSKQLTARHGVAAAVLSLTVALAMAVLAGVATAHAEGPAAPETSPNPAAYSSSAGTDSPPAGSGYTRTPPSTSPPETTPPPSTTPPVTTPPSTTPPEKERLPETGLGGLALAGTGLMLIGFGILAWILAGRRRAQV